MGINPVKDFDFTVYDACLGFESEYWYKRENDISTNNFYIGADSSATIQCTNSFEIIEGTGEINIGSEVSTYTAPFKFNTFDNSVHIDTDTATVVTYAELDGSTVYKSYKEGYSEEDIDDYYEDPSILLRYGLTVPTVVKWVGIGNDCRNNPLRLILDASILDVSTNFIPYEDSFEGELFYPSFKYLTPGTRNWEDYVFFDINDSLEYEQDGQMAYTSFRDLMFEDPYVDVFSKLVYSNNNVDGTKLRSSIVYYNNYKIAIDALINGLSFTFAINENARNVIDIQDWDRFRISAIAVPSRNKDNNKPMEIFINENTETILMVWYQGNDILNYNYRYSSIMPGKGVLDPTESVIKSIQWRGFETGDKHYSHVKTPFGVNNASLSSNIFNIYGILGTYDGALASPFAQLNQNFADNLVSVFNAYNGNEIVGSSFEFSNRSYDTFRQYVSYTYAKSDSTYGDRIPNWAYSYMRNENLYKTVNEDPSMGTCSLETLQNIVDFNNIEYYIFRGDTVYRNDNFSADPIQITINSPRTYNAMVTYNGWYRPLFNNILEFSYNEDQDIIDIFDKDFTFANTNLRSYNNIPQFWYNKVVETVTDYDVSVANAIDYREEWNPFASQWDADYYTRDYSGTSVYVDGYNSALELPSYFGSKLISLPEALELDSWDSTTTDEEFLQNKMELSYNLTRSIVNIFKNNDTFIDNWSDLTQSDNVIDGYIKTTVLEYYNISKPKIQVDIWRKPYKGEDSRIAYSLDDTFTKWTGANVDGVLNYINGEYIYTAAVDLTPMYVYFIKFTLFEK